MQGLSILSTFSLDQSFRTKEVSPCRHWARTLTRRIRRVTVIPVFIHKMKNRDSQCQFYLQLDLTIGQSLLQRPQKESNLGRFLVAIKTILSKTLLFLDHPSSLDLFQHCISMALGPQHKSRPWESKFSQVPPVSTSLMGVRRHWTGVPQILMIHLDEEKPQAYSQSICQSNAHPLSCSELWGIVSSPWLFYPNITRLTWTFILKIRKDRVSATGRMQIEG